MGNELVHQIKSMNGQVLSLFFANHVIYLINNNIFLIHTLHTSLDNAMGKTQKSLWNKAPGILIRSPGHQPNAQPYLPNQIISVSAVLWIATSSLHVGKGGVV